MMKINNTTPQVSNVINSTKMPAFTGFKKYIQDDLVKFQKTGTMSRHLFIVNAFAFLLGTRLITSRDNDEKREVMIRDIPTIIIAVIGVPIVAKHFAQKVIQPKSGFALMDEGEKSIYHKLRNIDPSNPSKGIMSYSKLEDMYIFNENLHSGFKGFSERLDKFGGNLKKIYSSLGDDIKSKLIGLSSNNKEFMKQLNSVENKGLLEVIKTTMSNKENKALKQASFLKTVPTILGFLSVFATVGVLIPKLNIYITEAIHRNKKNREEQASKAVKVK